MLNLRQILKRHGLSVGTRVKQTWLYVEKKNTTTVSINWSTRSLPGSKHATHLVQHIVHCQVNSAERRRKDQKVGKTVMDEKSFNYVRDNIKRSTYSISH